jgi:hypothetical protein
MGPLHMRELYAMVLIEAAPIAILKDRQEYARAALLAPPVFDQKVKLE